MGLGLGVYLLAGGLEQGPRTVAAVFAAAVVLWVTEALPLAITALLATVALVVTGALPARQAFAAYGDPIVLLFVGSFILAQAMHECGLDRRLAYWLLRKPWATRTASSMLLTLGVVACVISLFVSNTATTAMLLPIGLTILRAMNVQRRDHPVSNSYLLMLTWGSSVAVGTIVGTPPNVLGVGLIRQATGHSINFVDWAIFAMPITIALLLLAWLLLGRWRSEVPSTQEARVVAIEEYERLGPMKPSERATMLAFSVALALWIVPGLAEYVLGSDTALTKTLASRIPEAVAALIGAALLFVIPCADTESGRAISWRQASGIEWGTILLFAGGLALGEATQASGLAATVGHSIAGFFGATDVWAITAIAIGMGIVVSELASNTAAANIVVPVAIALAIGSGANPIPPALGATIGCNLGFMLPISTPPNAIIYSSGLVKPGVMMRTGLIFDLLGFALTWLSLRLILPAMGLADVR